MSTFITTIKWLSVLALLLGLGGPLVGIQMTTLVQCALITPFLVYVVYLEFKGV